jgi:5,10-methylene-tetrahydrofolate dehydrogenase/methenyl tetrahydrofolate cyclohydrolase/methionine synthase I (cobalamin-dependent)/5,10-methylenetetrahydrofolate reductase
MPARLIDGRQVAEARRARLAEQVRSLAGRGIHPCLAAISVHEDPAWSVYLRNQAAACAAVGIRHRIVTLPPGSGQQDLNEAIEALNLDADVHGVILQSPLRRAPGDEAGSEALSDFQAQAQLSPAKDVEGVNPANLGLVLAGRPGPAPCTAVAAVELAQVASAELDRTLRGMEAVVVGASTIAGKPIAQLLLAAGATVTVCHIDTKDLASHTRAADLLVVAVGRAGLISAALVKPGAIVIDVGINRIAHANGRTEIVGDVQAAVAEVAAAMTPVPGGVGALTTTVLLEATAQAAERLSEARPAVDGASLARVLGGAAGGLSSDVADRVADLIARHMVATPGWKPVRSAFERRLARGVLVIDGAMGSELIAARLAPGMLARANIDHPDLVQAVHQAYLDAGAEALTTNTFSVNRYRLHNDRELTVRLASAGVRLAREVARRSTSMPFVLGSIGPLGPVVGADITIAEAEDAFAEVALAMADAGVDAVTIETMPSTVEAVAALTGVRRVSRLPVLVSRSLDRDDPLEIAEFAHACTVGGASAVGVNCAAGPRQLIPVVARLARATSLPILARPNAGFPTREGGRLHYHLRPDYLVAQVRSYIAAGAGIVGGCCGVGPSHIAALVTAVAGTPLAPRQDAAAASTALAPAAHSAPAASLLALAGPGRFPIFALVPARLSPTVSSAALARLVAAGADAVGLLSGWPGATRGARLPARLRHLQDATGAPAVLELIAADTGLAAAQELLLTAHLLGIRAVIIDDGVFSSETRADAVGGGSEAVALVRAVKQLNAGRDLSGSRLEEPTAFTVGVRIAASQAQRLGGAGLDAGYVEAGADFLSLQPIYDPAVFRALMSGGRPSVPLFAEILVLPDAATADELDNELPSLSVPERLKHRLAVDPDEDAKGVLRFLGHWRERLAGVWLMLPDERTRQAEAIVRAIRAAPRSG